VVLGLFLHIPGETEGSFSDNKIYSIIQATATLLSVDASFIRVEVVSSPASDSDSDSDRDRDRVVIYRDRDRDRGRGRRLVEGDGTRAGTLQIKITIQVATIDKTTSVRAVLEGTGFEAQLASAVSVASAGTYTMQIPLVSLITSDVQDPTATHFPTQYPTAAPTISPPLPVVPSDTDVETGQGQPLSGLDVSSIDAFGNVNGNGNGNGNVGAPATKGMDAKEEGSQSNIAAIAGGVGGGVAALAIVVGLLYFYGVCGSSDQKGPNPVPPSSGISISSRSSSSSGSSSSIRSTISGVNVHIPMSDGSMRYPMTSSRSMSRSMSVTKLNDLDRSLSLSLSLAAPVYRPPSPSLRATTTPTPTSRQGSIVRARSTYEV
jgi:hypothetical protein